MIPNFTRKCCSVRFIACYGMFRNAQFSRDLPHFRRHGGDPSFDQRRQLFLSVKIGLGAIYLHILAHRSRLNISVFKNIQHKVQQR
jgi:hypothetical protein